MNTLREKQKEMMAYLTFLSILSKYVTLLKPSITSDSDIKVTKHAKLSEQSNNTYYDKNLSTLMSSIYHI